MTPGRATLFAAAWGAALALLAWLWIRSPLAGSATMIAVWSAPALPLLLVTWWWLRKLEVRQVPTGGAVVVGILLAWAAAGLLAWSGLGAEWALDGLILRRPGLRWGGRVVTWLPAACCLLIAVAGLAASLEARYRIAHGEVGGGAGLSSSGRGSPGGS